MERKVREKQENIEIKIWERTRGAIEAKGRERRRVRRGKESKERKKKRKETL